MALEDLTGPNKFIANLVPANPPATDPASQGADHIQGIKNVLQNSFPGMAGAYQCAPGYTLKADLAEFKAQIGRVTAPAAGEVGELVEANFAGGVNVGASGTYGNVSSFTLQPGVWDVNALQTFTSPTGATLQTVNLYVSLTSGTPDLVSFGTVIASGFIAGFSSIISTPPRRLVLTVPTLVYSVYRTLYGAGQPTLGAGFLQARRVA